MVSLIRVIRWLSLRVRVGWIVYRCELARAVGSSECNFWDVPKDARLERILRKKGFGSPYRMSGSAGPIVTISV
jgi:hypothetical protein